MPASFLFYDLETSGFNPRDQRIMQFAAQRTDMDLKPIDDPYNYLIKLSDDILPDPEAVLLTGITPQATITEGITEAEFLKTFVKEISTPNTIFVGFNSIRFDDEFMRFLHYRNFYDAYEWQWQEGRSRWDMLDVVRMTRALRPEGIKWPVDSEGKPANKLGLLTSINRLDHINAHDALSDVQATLALAQLLRAKQPKLFNYLLEQRDKKKVSEVLKNGQCFVYTSGKYASEFEKTTVAMVLADHPKRQSVLVYDLRHDPASFLHMTPVELADIWKYQKDTDAPRLPIKTLQFNKCPAVAPLSVLDPASQKRLKLDLAVINTNKKKLYAQNSFITNVLAALELMDNQRQASFLQDDTEVDAKLYDGFFADSDRNHMRAVRTASTTDLRTILSGDFEDERLNSLLMLYKARNFPKSLNDSERDAWEKFRYRKLLGGKAASRTVRYFERLAELAEQKTLTDKQRYLLEELQLWGQAIMPIEN